MASRTRKSLVNARATCIIRVSDVVRILCHRRKEGREQYLVEWRGQPGQPVPPRAIYSWHSLDELTRALHPVQKYVESRPRVKQASATPPTTLAPPTKRKRKSSTGESEGSRDQSLGISTSATSAGSSRATSVTGSVSSLKTFGEDEEVYNGVLERKEGWIVAKKAKPNKGLDSDAVALPTTQMIDEASRTPVAQAERAIREAFYRKVQQVPRLSLKNKIDSSTPSLEFIFVKDYVLGDGVYRTNPADYEGCQRPCRPNMGQNIGCEYPRECSCLEYAAVNEGALEREEPALYREYMRQKKEGNFIDTANLPKRFPYHRPKGEHTPQTLQPFYRDSRHPIYECNVNCKCGPICKSRVVQKGRKVALTIFKTHNRGWGVSCDEDLLQGEFIDTYRGEIITNEETDCRESQAGTRDKASYLYSLDKFVGGYPGLTADNCFVVDGQYMGGPTRFINHSCEPNCRQYTVSYNKHDRRVYDLAFFAIEDIAAGTELTFDYMDKDEAEEEDVIREREAAAQDPGNRDRVACNCGSRKCRGYLWM